MSHRFSLAVLLAAVALSPSARAAQAPDDDVSEWEAYTAPTDGTPNSPVGQTTTEGGFSAPERVVFGEKMRQNVLDQLCRNLKLEYNYSLPGDFNGTGGGFKRWLAPMPDGRLTIVDEERLSVGYGHGFTKALGDTAGIGLWLGGRVDGTSMVIRPLAGKSTCKELDTLFDLRDIKTVLPFKGERIAAMQVGELWRLPFNLTVGHTESLTGVPVNDLAVSLTFNGAETGAATLTLYRLSESELRFRFRIDRVEIRTRGGQLADTIPAIQFASLGANILAKFVDHELASQMKRYTLVSLGFANSRSHGKRVLLEYVVDPRDPAAAEAVATALHGDFQALVKMARHLGTQQATEESTEAAYLAEMKKHDAEFGPASYAAIDTYTEKARNITLNLPFLTNQHWANLASDNTLHRYSGEGGEYYFQRADKSRVSEYINIPFVGPLIKDSVQRDVQVVTQAKAGEAYGDPIVVYLQQHGFLRATESSVREKAEELAKIMALAGTRGGGPNERMALPLAGRFIEPPVPVYSGRDGQQTNQEPANRKGMIAFTLVFSEAGVKQLTSATAEDILKSYAAVSESQPAMKWLLDNGQMGEDGKLGYDWKTARRAFPDEEGRRSPEMGELETLAKEASGLVTDLLAARNAPDNQARAAALAKAFGGGGDSGLAYDRALKVFVQLVDPMNLTGDFVTAVDRPKKEGDLALHLVLKRNRPENELLKGAGAAKSRFAQPSILVD
jgi:hypothetical protein